RGKAREEPSAQRGIAPTCKRGRAQQSSALRVGPVQRAGNLVPARTHLGRGCRAGGAKLLNGDRGDEITEGGGLVERGAGGPRQGDAGAGAVAGADDVDGTA